MKGFTLVELLVVIGIMGLLGTASVGGYRQMRRGMEEKGVLQDVNTLIRAAYQRAQIDRQPTAVVFWNETLRGDSDDADESAIVVGRAVAVRRSGRITGVKGDLLAQRHGSALMQASPAAHARRMCRAPRTTPRKAVQRRETKFPCRSARMSSSQGLRC